MGLSWIHILVVVVLVVLLFGSNRVSTLMGDFAKGIKSFKKGLSEEDEPKSIEPKTIDGNATRENTNAKDKAGQD
jgi:sec-independent protein translocase protein TatA